MVASTISWPGCARSRIRIDGVNYTYGSSGVQTLDITKNANDITTTFRINNVVDVTQKLSIVPSRGTCFNDTVEIQRRLSRELLRIRVRPYYLYHADEVRGTEHLRTPVERGLEILEGLRGHTSGLGVPTFVIDVPGGGGKIPLLPNYVVSWTDEELTVRNYEGLTFRYRNPADDAAGRASTAAASPPSPRLARRRQRSDTARKRS